VIEHGGSMIEETIGLLVEKTVPIVTTFAAFATASDGADTLPCASCATIADRSFFAIVSTLDPRVASVS
jgi:hypothetical protein